MQGSSTIMTVGTALRRAHESDLTVEVLVGNHWVSGRVAAIDSHGVMMKSNDGLMVVSLTSVDAVRIAMVPRSWLPIPVGGPS